MKRKKENGSITVEAALFLPLFFFAFLSIYNLIYFARAQVLVQYAAAQTAKEVAQYTYILDKIGILEKMDKSSLGAENFKKNLIEVKENFDVIKQAAENASKGEITISDTVQVGDALEDSYETVSGYIEDPKSFVSGFLKCVKSYTRDEVTRYMIHTVTKGCVNKQVSIAGGGIEPDEYLSKLGIVGAKNHKLDFKNSKWCAKGSRDIKIVVDYEIASRLPFFWREPRHYRVCASTRAWSGV